MQNKPNGRPKTLRAAVKISMNLEPEEIEKAKLIGGGNMTKGIKIALTAHKKKPD